MWRKHLALHHFIHYGSLHDDLPDNFITQAQAHRPMALVLLRAGFYYGYRRGNYAVDGIRPIYSRMEALDRRPAPFERNRMAPHFRPL